jgi:transposase
MAKQLTDFERGQIAALHKAGMSHREIAAEIGRSKCAVTYYLANPEDHGKKKRPGRPQEVSPRDQRRILRCATNTGTSAAKIKSTLELPFHRSTVKRVLNRSPNLKYTKRMGKPPLKPEHKKARLDWARSHMEFGDNWRKVVWSDEKKFNLDGPDGLQYYWHYLRKEPELFSKNANGGGSVMIWAGFGWNGKTDMAFIDGRLNAVGYQNMLEEYLLPKGPEIGG